MVADNRVHHQFICKPGERLEQFEHEWLTGRIPSIAEYFRESDFADVRYMSDLIELDLEYRWRGFGSASIRPAQDDHGFPQFPRLEDYAALIPDGRRKQVLVPQLLAEEYRVRTRWGDRPERQSFIERFPDDPAAIETALDGIDAEFAIEEVVFTEDQPSESLADQSTVTFSRRDSSETTAETDEIAAPGGLGKYRLEARIGSGGFGEVWKAFDPALKRHVAIKIPRPDKRFSPAELSSFRREAEKLATLGRVAGIVTVFDYGEHNGQPYIVSDFIEGESLESRLKRGALTYEESAELIAEIAAALNQVHLKNLVHRDIKPANILLDSDGKPFIADFGLCVSEAEQLREGHGAFGTFAYMSPEQARGESHRTDGRADIYALGVVLYRMLTGRLPFIDGSPSDYRDQILHREPRPLRSIDPKIPAELEHICLKCLRKSIIDRYTTAGDLASDLQRVGRKATTWHPRSNAAAALLLTLIAAAVVLYFRMSAVPAWGTPTPYVYSPYDEISDSYGWVPKRKRYEFQTNGESLFAVGVCNQDELTLRIRFRVHGNDPVGQAGFFWAWAPVVADNKADLLMADYKIDFCCWAVQVGRVSQGAPFVVEIRQQNVGPSGGFRRVLYQAPACAPIQINAPQIHVFTVDARVTRTEVLEVKVNGQSLLDDPVPLDPILGREWHVLNGTEYGIFGAGGSFSVEAFSVQ